jgi:hypothetical protein
MNKLYNTGRNKERESVYHSTCNRGKHHGPSGIIILQGVSSRKSLAGVNIMVCHYYIHVHITPVYTVVSCITKSKVPKGDDSGEIRSW